MSHDTSIDLGDPLAVSSRVADLAERASAYAPDLAWHGERVADLAAHVARRLGLRGADLLRLRWAALLHDVGKTTWPLELWTKPGDLTAHERLFVNLHVQASERLVVEHGLTDLAPGVRHHHERWDGGGYPDKLGGAAIPFAARVIAVADVYDVLCHGRPYRRALDERAALAELRRCAGTQFDPRCVDALVETVTGGARRHLAAPTLLPVT
ncbi:HD-GYP domain-containing protein [Deinococcus yavapaiensis]|uniref:Putative nucleotidyltransferase with HDIG domain n=1 Tax=Deinococcus yavapaiensis KR-236 TaxID=694435 RepID=A0A318SHG2_9DEIO|nr:HD domain-containing phosphohydrolase [Deinococcus yavapaiensis]PYE56575.1 putative nucleotidyltransferase with HDIG domain [Deinococcus yavapaiensis KR-236]